MFSKEWRLGLRESCQKSLSGPRNPWHFWEWARSLPSATTYSRAMLVRSLSRCQAILPRRCNRDYHPSCGRIYEPIVKVLRLSWVQSLRLVHAGIFYRNCVIRYFSTIELHALNWPLVVFYSPFDGYSSRWGTYSFYGLSSNYKASLAQQSSSCRLMTGKSQGLRRAIFGSSSQPVGTISPLCSTSPVTIWPNWFLFCWISHGSRVLYWGRLQD